MLYPNNAGSRFDMDYYLNKHMPMVAARLGAALKGMTVDQGWSGGQPGSEAAFRAIASLSFDSREAFEQSFGPHAAEIQGDIPRYTDIVPILQVSEVRL